MRSFFDANSVNRIIELRTEIIDGIKCILTCIFIFNLFNDLTCILCCSVNGYNGKLSVNYVYLPTIAYWIRFQIIMRRTKKKKLISSHFAAIFFCGSKHNFIPNNFNDLHYMLFNTTFDLNIFSYLLVCLTKLLIFMDRLISWFVNWIIKNTLLSISMWNVTSLF